MNTFDCFWKTTPIVSGVPITRGPITIGRMNMMSNIIYIKIKGVDGMLIFDLYHKKSCFKGNIKSNTKNQFIDIFKNITTKGPAIEKSKSW